MKKDHLWSVALVGAALLSHPADLISQAAYQIGKCPSCLSWCQGNAACQQKYCVNARACQNFPYCPCNTAKQDRNGAACSNFTACSRLCSASEACMWNRNQLMTLSAIPQPPSPLAPPSLPSSQTLNAVCRCNFCPTWTGDMYNQWIVGSPSNTNLQTQCSLWCRSQGCSSDPQGRSGFLVQP
jgi:hypothetical protein